MTLPPWLRASKAAAVDPSRALAMAGAWWAFWVLDLQAWQAWTSAVWPAWAWLALSWGYGALALWWPRFIGGPAMLSGLSGACMQTLAINSITVDHAGGVAISATMLTMCLMAMVVGQHIADLAPLPQREVWTLALCLGQACAVVTAIIAWAASGLCC